MDIPFMSSVLVAMRFRDKVISFLFIVSSPLCLCVDHFQETLTGIVDAGNYSYYWLPHPGTVILQLWTINGDADLYVSSKKLKPTFDIESHELQSTTCGVEQIKVSSVYDRPLSIAVYGHPSHDISVYELKIDVYYSYKETETDTDIHPEFQEAKKTHSRPTSPPNLSEKDDTEYEERSVFWTLFLRVLQVLLDLLVD